MISKKKLMYRFTVKQLKQIAEKEGVDVIGLSRKGEVVDALLYRIEFKKFVHYAKRYGVKYGDIIEELREFKKQLDSGKNKSKKVAKRTTKNQMKTNVGNKATPEETITNRIIKLISKFEPVTIARDEKELKVQLVQWLQAHFGKENVKIEYPFEHGKIDIVVNDEVAIEVKVALSKQSMKNLLGEVQTDKMYFSSVIAVIFDVGKNVGLEFLSNR